MYLEISVKGLSKQLDNLFLICTINYGNYMNEIL